MQVLGKFALTCSVDLPALLDLDNIDNRYSVGYVLRFFLYLKISQHSMVSARYGAVCVCWCVGGKCTEVRERASKSSLLVRICGMRREHRVRTGVSRIPS